MKIRRKGKLEGIYRGFRLRYGSSLRNLVALNACGFQIVISRPAVVICISLRS